MARGRADPAVNDSLRRACNEQRGRTAEKHMTIARTVDRIADELGASSAQVAVAWVSAQGYRYIPIVGARKPEQITDTLGGIGVKLSDEQLARLDEVSRPDLGFPHDFLASKGVQDVIKSELRSRLDERPQRRLLRRKPVL
jgi:aryl-alcohol dehydrogenase-like predicted oxidoreductase